MSMIRSNLILFLLLISTICYAQKKSDKNILAKIGTEVITVEEFKQRFELVPQVNQSKKSVEERKSELLYTLIAERLWSQEADELGFDTTDIMNYTFRNLEKMYARDALYKEEIESKINIDDALVRKALLRIRKTLNFKVLKAKTQKDADDLFQKLKSGISFDTLIVKQANPAFKDSLFKVSYGQLPEDIEDKLYSLEKGKYSEPINASNGWYLFKLISVDEMPIQDDKQLGKQYTNIKKALYENTTNELNGQYFRKFFGDKKIKTNGDLFWRFSEKIIDGLLKLKQKNNIADYAQINLTSPEFVEIKNEIGTDALAIDFIELDKNPVTLKEFYTAFVYEGFYTFTTDPDTVRAKLNSRVKRFIEHELLSREAFNKNLHKLDDVKRDINIWRGNYLSKQLEKNVLDTVDVTIDEARKQFNSAIDKIGPMQVNIFEILTDSLEVIERVFKELEDGKRFQDLAREYTKRESTKDNNGEFGLFPITEHGEIGRIAADMEIGEVYGPLKLEEGYSIFKLIGKKVPPEKSDKSFEEVKDNYIKQLKSAKLFKTKVGKTVELANKYDINIDQKVLESIKVKNLTMLVFKNFGFGGSGLAMPLTTPFYQWVEEWKKSKQDLP